MEDRQLSLKWNNQKKTFFENLKVLREKSNYTDATLAVDGKFYPVHKLVMITCSEYFSDIFQQTSCKSPVIVLKDVPCHDIEALLDYMYLGEVNVNQNDLTSLLKTAECLKIKGLAVPDEDPTKLCKKTIGIHVDAHRCSPPPKRQRYDSNTKPQHAVSPVPSPQMPASPMVSHVQSYSIPPHSTSNSDREEPPVVKIETDDDEEQEERFRREKNNEREAIKYHGTGEDYWSDISKTEHEVKFDDADNQDERMRSENNSEGVSDDRGRGGDYGYDIATTINIPEIYVNNSSLPESSLQEINQLFTNTSNTIQDETPVEQDQIYRKENNYVGANNGSHIPVRNYKSSLPKTTHKPDYGNTSFPGSSFQQTPLCGMLPSDTLANLITCQETYATHTNDDKQRWGRLLFKDGSLLLQDFRSDTPPTGALIFNLCDMTEHMSSPRHVYLSLSAKGKYLGRVVIRVNEQAPQRAQQLTDLCIGQTGDRYSGCRALRVLNKSDPMERLYFSSYLTANDTISVKKLYPSLEKTEGIAHMKGLVVMACEDRADFSILTKTGNTDLWPGPAIGKVVSGLPFVEYIVNYNLVKWHLSKSQVTITESGLVIDSGCQNWLLNQISKKGENGHKGKYSAD